MKKKDRIIFAIIGFLFCLVTIPEAILAEAGNLRWTGGFVVLLLAVSLAGGCAVGHIFARAKARRMREKEKSQRVKEADRTDAWKYGLVSFFLLALCFLPAYLAYYPGICAYDATMQTGQIADGAYNDHHPLAHTLLLGGSMKLGERVFGDANTGLAVLVCIQMLCLAGAVAFGMAMLWKRGMQKSHWAALQLCTMLYPFHGYMSVSVIKDVFFTVFFVIQILALCAILDRGERGWRAYGILFFVSSVGMQLFRNNGRYAVLVLLAGLLMAVCFGGERRKFFGGLLLNATLSFLAASLILSGLFRVTHAQQGDRREMLNLPIQQLARCMLYHGGVGVLEEDDGTMPPEDGALIQDFLLDEGYREYRPGISDPVKGHTNTYVVRYRTGEFAKTYLGLLVRYPGDFINAALMVNAGYLYVADVSHAHINENGTDQGLGYVQTRWVESELNPRGLYKASKWNGLHERMEKWADENAYLRLPVLRYLLMPGWVFWFYAALAGYLISRRDYTACLPLVLIAGYFGTLILGPTVQLRYLYPLITALPFVTYLSLTRRTDT